MDIPRSLESWFSLENYQGCSKLTKIQWAELIHGRYIIYQAYKTNDIEEYIHHLLLSNCYEPLKAANYAHNNDYLRLRHVHEHHRPLFLRNIRPFTVSDLSSLDISLNTVMREKGMLWDGEKAFTPEELELLCKETSTPCDEFCEEHEPRGIIVFNDEAPDDLLIEEFAKYLKEYRARIKSIKQDMNRKIEKASQPYNLLKWKILPYLDIYLWQLFTNSKPEHVKVGGLLFPDEVGKIDLSEYKNNDNGALPINDEG